MSIETYELIPDMVDNHIINKNYSHYVIDSDTFSNSFEITEKKNQEFHSLFQHLTAKEL